MTFTYAFFFPSKLHYARDIIGVHIGIGCKALFRDIDKSPFSPMFLHLGAFRK